jgi:hypothetical protein
LRQNKKLLAPKHCQSQYTVKNFALIMYDFLNLGCITPHLKHLKHLKHMRKIIIFSSFSNSAWRGDVVFRYSSLVRGNITMYANEVNIYAFCCLNVSQTFQIKKIK